MLCLLRCGPALGTWPVREQRDERPRDAWCKLSILKLSLFPCTAGLPSKALECNTHSPRPPRATSAA